MTTPPDWIKAAAEQIVRNLAEDEPVTPHQIEEGIKDAVKVITAKCPLEPDVAYMPVPRWIAVDERLPPEGPVEDYLVFVEGFIELGSFDEGVWLDETCRAIHPTHWMPLPEGP